MSIGILIRVRITICVSGRACVEISIWLTIRVATGLRFGVRIGLRLEYDRDLGPDADWGWGCDLDCDQDPDGFGFRLRVGALISFAVRLDLD